MIWTILSTVLSIVRSKLFPLLAGAAGVALLIHQWDSAHALRAQLAAARAEAIAAHQIEQAANDRQAAADAAAQDAQEKVAEYDRVLQKLRHKNRCLVTDADLAIGRLRFDGSRGRESHASRRPE